MLEGISSSESTLTNQTKAGLIALQQSAESERQIADLLTRQVQETKASSQVTNNPPYLGQNVDTYA